MLSGVRSCPVARGLRRLHTVTAPQAISPEHELDFSDPRKVFDKKSSRELVRSLAILKLCSQDWFVDNALTVSAENAAGFDRSGGLKL